MAQAALKKKIKEEFPERNDMNYVEIDLSSTPTQEIVYECENLALGCDKKVVVGFNAYFLEKKSKVKAPKEEESKYLLEYLAYPNPDVDLYFVVYSDNLDTKSEFYKLIDQTTPTIVSVSELNDQEWIKYITSYFKKRGIVIDLDAAYEFHNRFQGDYSTFMSYAEKLVSYAIESQHITKAEIQELVAAPLEENSFLLSNALCKGNKKEALRIYEDLKVSSTDEIYLLNLLANQFRILSQVHYLYNVERLGAEQIATTLKITPGRVKASLMNLRNMNEKTCPLALEGIYEAEKGILTGKLQPRIAFSLFIVNFKLRP